MSVRRLANDTLQPARFAFGRDGRSEARIWIAKYPDGKQASAVIPLLMLAQDQDGWVTRAAIEEIASMLSLPFIRVLEVATFYTQFQLQPVGTKAHLQVCGTTPCMLRGAEDLIRVCKEKIHPEPFHRNGEGTLSWEEVECQGACVNAPMVMIFKDTYEDLTPQRLAEIIDEFEAGRGAGVKPGPQVERIFSAPQGGLTSLKRDLAKASAKPSKQSAKLTSAVPEAPAGKVSRKHPDRPAAMRKPAKADDLKLIAGIGPKLEKILHSLGIFSFAQIASWKKPERAWVDSYLKFAGRIERDDWVRQAKALAKGGIGEYIRVFGRKPR